MPSFLICIIDVLALDKSLEIMIRVNRVNFSVFMFHVLDKIRLFFLGGRSECVYWKEKIIGAAMKLIQKCVGTWISCFQNICAAITFWMYLNISCFTATGKLEQTYLVWLWLKPTWIIITKIWNICSVLSNLLLLYWYCILQGGSSSFLLIYSFVKCSFLTSFWLFFLLCLFSGCWWIRAVYPRWCCLCAECWRICCKSH
jgi:hypothetical protein